MHSFVPCCTTAQPSVFDSPAFRHSGFYPLSSSFSPLLPKVDSPASAPGGGDWAIVHELFLFLQSWMTIRTGVLCISSVSTPCSILILFYRGECAGRRQVYIYICICIYVCVYIYVICVPWSLILGLRGVLSLEYFASDLFSLRTGCL